MITSAKNIQNKRNDRQNTRTNGKRKAIQTKSVKEAYRCTLTKREKGKKYIFHCSQSSPPEFWYDSSIQVFHRFRVPQVDCGDLMRCS